MTETIIITVITSVLASSGVWSVLLFILQRKAQRQDKEADKDTTEKKMLLALAHDRIYYLCEQILREFADKDRTGTDVDEYENLRILYEGYRALGGNGTCERLFNEVSKLPITNRKER